MIEGNSMRCETEMMYQILQTAREDDRIRAVILNGSRTNSKKEPDFFQDFDVIYVVDEVAPFYRNLEWIKRFGELMILQMPDLMEDPRPDHEQRFTYLMQFVDGNRIDLTIYAKERLDELHRDSLSVLLLDKDGIVEPFPEPTEADYLPTPPTEELYDHCVNEFWWLGPYVAKGLWRQEIVFARKILDEYMRKTIDQDADLVCGCVNRFQRKHGQSRLPSQRSFARGDMGDVTGNLCRCG